jgi:hypothetical protein
MKYYSKNEQSDDIGHILNCQIRACWDQCLKWTKEGGGLPAGKGVWGAPLAPPAESGAELQYKTRGLGERCELPLWGQGQSPGRQRFLVNFKCHICALKIVVVSELLNLVTYES